MVDTYRTDAALEQINNMNVEEIALVLRVTLDRLCRLSKERDEPYVEEHPCWGCPMNHGELCKQIYDFYLRVNHLTR